MTVQEFIDKASSMTEQEWAYYFKLVWDIHYCPVSQATILKFQKDWYASPDRPKSLNPESLTEDFQRFRAAQKEEAVKCLSMEMSKIGEVIRAKFHMRTLEPGTDLEVGERLVRHKQPA